MVSEIYRGFGTVDIGDHYRQGILFPEEVWKTNMAWHRAFSTILGCEVCDGYFLYLLDFARARGGNRDGALPFLSWIVYLSKQLINFVDDEDDNGGLRRNIRRHNAIVPEQESRKV